MMCLCLQILSDLKDGGVQGWVYWQVRSLFLNDFLSLGIVYASICEAQDSGQACCIILLPVAGTAVVHSACIQNKSLR